MISRTTKTPDGSQLEMLQIQQAAPNHHRRGLTGGRSKIGFIDQQYPITSFRKMMKQAGTAHAAADNQDVELSGLETVPLLITAVIHFFPAQLVTLRSQV